MGEGEVCGNKKSDIASLGRKLKLHVLVYIIDIIDLGLGLGTLKTYLSTLFSPNGSVMIHAS